MPRQELHFSSAVAGVDALQWNAMATVLWEEEEPQNLVPAGLLWCLQHGEHHLCVEAATLAVTSMMLALQL
jgi:hypothetical protein